VNEKGVCADHDPALKQRVRLRKQREIKYLLDNAPAPLSQFQSYDQRVEGGVCGQERPDFVWDCGTHIVVLEVDEYQHRNYPPACERVRMVNLVSTFGLRTVFVRYNPDEYQGQTVAVRPRHRQTYLAAFLRRILQPEAFRGPNFAEVVYLFFDGFDMGVPATHQRLAIA
jgi:hypothetical protein